MSLLIIFFFFSKQLFALIRKKKKSVNLLFDLNIENCFNRTLVEFDKKLNSYASTSILSLNYKRRKKNINFVITYIVIVYIFILIFSLSGFIAILFFA